MGAYVLPFYIGFFPALPVSNAKSHTPCGSPRFDGRAGLLIRFAILDFGFSIDDWGLVGDLQESGDE
jgi:hypothetical protein